MPAESQWSGQKQEWQQAKHVCGAAGSIFLTHKDATLTSINHLYYLLMVCGVKHEGKDQNLNQIQMSRKGSTSVVLATIVIIIVLYHMVVSGKACIFLQSNVKRNKEMARNICLHECPDFCSTVESTGVSPDCQNVL